MDRELCKFAETGMEALIDGHIAICSDSGIAPESFNKAYEEWLELCGITQEEFSRYLSVRVQEAFEEVRAKCRMEGCSNGE